MLAHFLPSQFRLSLPGGFQVGQWRFLTLLDETVEQDHAPLHQRKNTRAHTSPRSTRISHRPRSIFLTSGMPRGQPVCTVLISIPINCRCSRDSWLSHSRTGSLPTSVRKNLTVKTSDWGFEPKRTKNGTPFNTTDRYAPQQRRALKIQGKKMPPSGGINQSETS